MQIYKLMLGEDFRSTDHNCFPTISMLCTHNNRRSKNNNFVIERPRTGLALNCYRYLGIKLWNSASSKMFKNGKFKYSYKNFC